MGEFLEERKKQSLKILQRRLPHPPAKATGDNQGLSGFYRALSYLVASSNYL